MSKFHSTVSRRDFMKGLGLAGAGIGAAAAAAPVFHDLDEAAASPQAGWKRPWYVKQLDFENPSYELDWSRMQRRDKTVQDPDGGGNVYSFLYRGSSNPQATAIMDAGGTSTDPGTLVGKWIDDRFPGWQGDSLKNEALAGAVGRPLSFYNFPSKAGKTWFLGLDSATTPEQRGMSKWTGTPEEALKMLRAALRFFGAQDVGVVELTANTEKLMVGKESNGLEYIIDPAADEPYEEAGKKWVFPTRFKYIINYTNLQSTELTPRQPSGIGKSATQMSYNHWPRIAANLQQFLRGLGYRGLGGFSSIFPSNVIGSLSGVGEHTRMGNPVISPEYGGHLRAMSRMLTDLPLEPTKPIDAGINRFCYTCKICAENCPTEALMMGDPTYEPGAEWRPASVYDVAYAHKGWYMNNYRCIVCGACQGYCPFNSTKHSPIHSLVFATVSYVPLLDAFNAEMQRFFHYGFKDPDTWWDLDDPVYGVSTKFTGKTS